MEKLEKMTTVELAAMDDEAIEKLVRLEVAERGVSFAPQPKELASRKFEIEKSEKGYKVGELIFKNLADAEKVASMEIVSEEYDYNGAGYDVKWLKPREDVSVETAFYYKKTEVLANRSEIRLHNEDKKNYEKSMSRWKDYEREVSQVRDEVYSTVWAAQRKQNEIDAAKEKYEDFKDLANGDEEVAKRFFRNAFSENPGMIEAVLGEKQPGEETQTKKEEETDDIPV